MRALKTEIEALRAERNAISAAFQDAAPEEKAGLGRKAKAAGAEAGELEERARRQGRRARGAAAASCPTSPGRARRSGRTRASTSSSASEGEPPNFDFEPLDHVALIEKNDWADLSRITQVAGSRTYCLKGRLALLEQALMLWAQQRLAADGFTPMTVPALARQQAFVDQGHFPGHEEETYELPNDDL